MQATVDPHGAPIPTPEQQAVLSRIEKAAKLFDTSIPLPAGLRVGIDGLVGLIPGVGDVIMGVSAAYIVRESSKLGLPKGTLSRMIFNVIIDTGLGLIPVAGDVFDFFFKCNLKNVNLARAHFGMAPLDLNAPPNPQKPQAQAQA